MKTTLVVAAALAGVASAQGVTEIITPKTPTPKGCKTSFDGTFEVTVVDIKKRDLQPERRAGACGGDGILVTTLAGGVLKDAKSRVGYIAANYQFQFDGPPQSGAIITGGFSLCENNELALGGSKTFYKCQSGSFFNLYDRTWADHCYPVSIVAMPCGGNVAQIADGQVVGTTVVPTTMVTVLADGQPQVVTTSAAIPLCQIGDGQLQAHTTDCVHASAKPTMTAPPVSQYSDGQIQVTGPAAPPASTGAASAPAPGKPAASTTLAKPSQPSSPAATSSTAVVAGASSLSKSNAFGALVIGILGALLYL